MDHGILPEFTDLWWCCRLLLKQGYLAPLHQTGAAKIREVTGTRRIAALLVTAVVERNKTISMSAISRCP